MSRIATIVSAVLMMLILSLAFISTPTFTHDAPPTFADGIPENQGTLKDLRITEDMPEVKLYAERFDVSLSEAARRLNLQDSVDDYYEQIEEKHIKTFAGLHFEHEPKFRIVIQFTNGIPADTRRDVPDSAREDIEYREVRFSLAELEAAQEEVVGILDDRGLKFPSSISLSKNAVEIYASSRDAGNALLASIDASLAEKITIADPIVLDLPEPEIGETTGYDRYSKSPAY